MTWLLHNAWWLFWVAIVLAAALVRRARFAVNPTRVATVLAPLATLTGPLLALSFAPAAMPVFNIASLVMLAWLLIATTMLFVNAWILRMTRAGHRWVYKVDLALAPCWLLCVSFYGSTLPL